MVVAHVKIGKVADQPREVSVARSRAVESVCRIQQAMRAVEVGGLQAHAFGHVVHALHEGSFRAAAASASATAASLPD